MSAEEDKAWEKIMHLAEAHSMVLQAAGGVAVIAHPDAQREKGVDFRAQQLHKSRKDCPTIALARQRAAQEAADAS